MKLSGQFTALGWVVAVTLMFLATLAAGAAKIFFTVIAVRRDRS